MKKTVFAFSVLIMFLLSAGQALALTQIAGSLRFNVTRGGEAVAQHGVLTNENGTINVSFYAEGDAAKYLSFPESGLVVPEKINYFDVKASVPANYQGNGLVLGWFYTTQAGEGGGAAKLNVRLVRKVVIFVTDAMDNQTNYTKLISDFKFGQQTASAQPPQTQKVATQAGSEENSGGLVVGSSGQQQGQIAGIPWLWIGIGLVVLVVLGLFLSKRVRVSVRR